MAQANVSSIDVVICHEVTSLVSCTLDELAQRVPPIRGRKCSHRWIGSAGKAR